MKLTEARTGKRPGFTLIELLIVIAIIGVLISLISAAIYKALVYGKQVRNRSDLSQLEVSIQQFKQKFGVYPPSKLMLCEKLQYYYLNNDPTTGTYVSLLAQDSVAFITKVFPNIDVSPGGQWWNSNPTVGINWNGNKDGSGADLIAPNPSEPATYAILEGDQCLVFCLGGIPGLSTVSNPPVPGAPQCLGFSANPKNPAYSPNFLVNPNAPDDRVGPFFEFNSGRLVVIPADPNPQPNALNPLSRSPWHYSYLDTHGSSDGFGRLSSGPPYPVYAYFSSYKAANGYNRYLNTSAPFSDCPSLIAGVPTTTPWAFSLWPYVGSNPTASGGVKYLNPNTFQIISAGTDNLFGSGSVPVINTVVTYNPLWSPALASQVYPQGSAGYDDQSNFSPSILGSGQ